MWWMAALSLVVNSNRHTCMNGYSLVSDFFMILIVFVNLSSTMTHGSGLILEILSGWLNIMTTSSKNALSELCPAKLFPFR
jgi:hypothetical protein